MSAAMGMSDGVLGDPTGLLAVTSVLRLRELLVHNVEKCVAPFDLSATDYLVLATIAFVPDAMRPLSQVARAMLVHPTTVTQAVDRMETRKLVKRLQHPTDRRTTLAALTARGRSLTKKATAALRENGFGMAGVSDRDLAALVEAITPMRGAAGDDPNWPTVAGAGGPTSG